MQFNKTLKTLLRAKQEGQNDSYKAGFNDAIALLDQEEQHIEFENHVELHKHIPSQFHDGEDSHENIDKHQHKQAVDDLDEKMEILAKETVNELASFKEEVESKSYTKVINPPTIEIDPGSFSLTGTDGEGVEGVSQSLVHGSQEEDKDDSKDKHEAVDNDEQLDDEDMKKQHQLQALALARKKAQEKDDEEDE